MQAILAGDHKSSANVQELSALPALNVSDIGRIGRTCADKALTLAHTLVSSSK